MPVAVWVMRPAHRVIFAFVRQQPGPRFNNFGHIGADQAHRARIYRFGRSVVSRITSTGLPNEGASS